MPLRARQVHQKTLTKIAKHGVFLHADPPKRCLPLCPPLRRRPLAPDHLNDVDNDRIGCAGLSGGGLRTVYLGGLDHRVKCAVSVGFMSTWSDFLLNKSYTHTWMTYAPLMPKYLDFPEVLGLRVPLPTMTLNNNQDGLFTLPEMKKADSILQEIFDKAGASDKYKGGFYEGDHKFDIQMQNDAFNWFDKWLG